LFTRPELRIALLSLNEVELRLGLLCSYFRVTLLALLIFFFLTNTGILGMIRLKETIIFKGQDPPQSNLTSSTGS
jgi:hypothetical protein